MIQSIHQIKVKRDFLNAFKEDPVNFMKKFIQSHNNDMGVILGDMKINREDSRKSEFYKGDWVEQSVLHYLNSR